MQFVDLAAWSVTDRCGREGAIHDGPGSDYDVGGCLAAGCLGGWTTQDDKLISAHYLLLGLFVVLLVTTFASERYFTQ